MAKCITVMRDHFQLAVPHLPEAIEQFVQIKPKLLAEMRVGNLPRDLLVAPAPIFILAEIGEGLVLNVWDRSVHAQCVISIALTSMGRERGTLSPVFFES